MEYFKSGLKSVLGAQQGLNQPTGAETVEKLVERVRSSTLLDDRRDACRALKSLSKKFRLEVGAQGMDILIQVLEADHGDAEIVGYALDALSNVISGPQDDEDYDPTKVENENLGHEFTEIYIKRPENVALLLDLLEEFDFRVRWPSVKLLTGLLMNKPKELQECILVSPMGVSRLMDLLSDSREVIRNDVLLLLSHLTKSNANIQKIVAFENAFDRLLDIISEEGYSDGGVVVEDSLLVLLNLLKNNTSNQNFFKEGSYIQKLIPFFKNVVQGDGFQSDQGWSAQKVTNIHLMLQVVRTLVTPTNPYQMTSSCQKVMNQCGFLGELCSILMANGVPADILTETINTVGEVIRGHHGNQEFFAAVNAPSSPPRPAIVVLLMSMVNEKQPFVLRCAVLYCFQCFLYKNELGQAQIIQTLLPTSADISTITAGQLLCGGLFSADALSNWFAAVALSHSLVDNPTQKEQLLRVQLATNVGSPPVSLLKQCTAILQQGGKVQTRLGILMLLCMWLARSTMAVNHFLSIPTNVPYLTSQVGLAEGDENEDLVQGICAFLLGICIESNDDTVPSFTRDALCQLIMKRVGLETFLDKLNAVSKHESYSFASQRPQMKHRQASDVFFDYEFCRLFKSIEGTIIKEVQPKPKELMNGPESTMTPDQHNLLQRYKNLIREQDQHLSDVRGQLEELKVEHEKSQAQVTEMCDTIQQLRDQNALLKAHRAASGERSSSPGQELAQTKQELSDLKQQHEEVQKQMKEASEALARLKFEQELKQQTEMSEQASINSSGTDDLQETVRQQQQHISQLTETVAQLNLELTRVAKEDSTLQVCHEENEKLKSEKDAVQSELDSVKKEQEDLLVLLTEQDTKLKHYIARLKSLGEKVEEDEDADLSGFDDNEDAAGNSETEHL